MQEDMFVLFTSQDVLWSMCLNVVEVNIVECVSGVCRTLGYPVNQSPASDQLEIINCS